MAPASCTIRHARRGDVSIILELIHELAAYEKEPRSTVEATEDKLRSTVAFAPDGVESASTAPNTESTSPERPARCLILFNESGAPAGMALYFYNYSTWRAKPGVYLEDLFVKESERKKGYGKRLLVELAKEVVAMDGGRLEWVVLKWNEPSIGFYEKVIGAKMMSDWVGMRVDGEALTKLAGM
ncbi:acetyltransferase [Xylariales sp. AK1849]|nr:acetyltransferase [Xylariales sp. AK1849]